MKKDLSETVVSGDVAISNPPLGKPRIRKKPKWAKLVREDTYNTKFKVKCKGCGFRGPTGEQDKNKVTCPSCGSKKEITITDIER